jgi:hypothetical protein
MTGGALAATGLVSVGDRIASDESAAPEHPPTGVEETILATGEAPVAGPWQISTRISPAMSG